MTVTAYRINKLRLTLKCKVEKLKKVVLNTEKSLNGARITEEYRRLKAKDYTPLRAEVDTILWTVSMLGLKQEFTPEKCGYDWVGTIL